MKKVLFIQLYRLGDILQALHPAIATSVDHEVHFLFSSQFDIRLSFQNLNIHFHSMDQDLIQKLNTLNKNLLNTLLNTDHPLIQKLKTENFNQIINLQHGNIGSFITSLLAHDSCQTIGPFFNRKLQEMIQDDGSFKTYLTAKAIDLSQTNLVLQFAQISNTSTPLDIFQNIQINHTLEFQNKCEKLNINKSPFIIILPGSSHPQRRWSPQNFATLINLWAKEMDDSFLILGSNEEQYLFDEIQQQTPLKLINAMGIFHMNELGALISKSKLVIGNDTGPLHWTPYTHTPSVCLYVHHAHPPTTAPYSTKSLCLYQKDGHIPPINVFLSSKNWLLHQSSLMEHQSQNSFTVFVPSIFHNKIYHLPHQDSNHQTQHQTKIKLLFDYLWNSFLFPKNSMTAISKHLYLNFKASLDKSELELISNELNQLIEHLNALIQSIEKFLLNPSLKKDAIQDQLKFSKKMEDLKSPISMLYYWINLKSTFSIDLSLNFEDYSQNFLNVLNKTLELCDFLKTEVINLKGA